VSIVSVTVALGAVPLSLLADRWSRVKGIFVMVLIWSLATISCAFAGSYAQLMAARSAVGLGEAAYGTVGGALLASLFPLRMRGTVLGAFLAAAMVGSVLGVMLGGFIAQRWGWQAGFGAVGIPGLLLSLLFLFVVRDYKTVALPRSTRANGAAKTAALTVTSELLRPRTALVTCIGAGGNLAVFATSYAWLPSYFNRYYGLAPDRAGATTAIVVLAGGVGALVWSAFADRLTRRLPRARLMVPAATALLTAIFVFIAFGFLSPGRFQFALIVAAGFVMTGSVGSTDAVIVDVIHPSLRATAVSILALTRNLFGLATGPLLTGALSDAYGLPFAMSILPIFCILAAGLYLIAARTYEADLKGAEDGIDASMGGLEPRAA
jgi:MFS family permease